MRELAKEILRKRDRSFLFCLVLVSFFFGLWVPAQALTLKWDMNSHALGYKVYMGTMPGTYDSSLDVGNVNNYTVPTQNLVAGLTYYFCTTSYDAQNNETPCSHEVLWKVRANPNLAQLSVVFLALPSGGGSVLRLDSQGFMTSLHPVSSNDWQAIDISPVFCDGGFELLGRPHAGLASLVSFNGADAVVASRSIEQSPLPGGELEPQSLSVSGDSLSTGLAVMSQVGAGSFAVSLLGQDLKPVRTIGPLAADGNMPRSLSCSALGHCLVVLQGVGGGLTVMTIPAPVWQEAGIVAVSVLEKLIPRTTLPALGGWSPVYVHALSGNTVYVLYGNGGSSARVVAYRIDPTASVTAPAEPVVAADFAYQFSAGFVPVTLSLGSRSNTLYARDARGKIEVLVLDSFASGAVQNIVEYDLSASLGALLAAN